MYLKTCIFAVCACLGGCISPSFYNPDADYVPEFKRVYSSWSATRVVSFSQPLQDRRVTFSYRDAKLVDVLRYLANECGVSAICAESLDSRPCTVEVRDETVSAVMSYLAKRYDVQITCDGRFYYIGRVSNSDKTVLVMPVYRLKDSEWKDLTSPLLSENGKVAVADGILVCCDYGTVTGRMARAVEQINSADIGCYIVQLWVLSLERDDARELGMDLTPTGDISAVLASGKVSSALGASIAGKLQYLCSRKHDDISCNTLFLLNDGAEGSFVRGVKVPIAKTSVSNQGAVSVIGYDYTQTGLQLSASVRSLSPDRVRMVLDVSNSSIQSYVGAAPQTLNQQLKCSPVVHVGDVYLLGSLDIRGSGKTEYLAGLKLSKSVGAVQVWGRVYRISDLQGAQIVGGAEGGTPSGGRLKTDSPGQGTSLFLQPLSAATPAPSSAIPVPASTATAAPVSVGMDHQHP